MFQKKRNAPAAIKKDVSRTVTFLSSRSFNPAIISITLFVGNSAVGGREERENGARMGENGEGEGEEESDSLRSLENYR